MKNIAKLLVAGLFLSTAAAQAAPRLAPEARLARVLEGRVAGEPVDCVQLRNVRSSQIIDGTAILYTVGSTIYVNRPRSGQQSLDSSDTLLTNTHSNRLCSIDVVDLYDASSRMRTGSVFLGEFVPYTRPGR